MFFKIIFKRFYKMDRKKENRLIYRTVFQGTKRLKCSFQKVLNSVNARGKKTGSRCIRTQDMSN